MVRDAMLSVSGVLDSKLGGPSFLDHSVPRHPGTAAILYASHRSQRRPERIGEHCSGHGSAAGGATCSTPSTAPTRRPSAPRRAVTTTPLQALSMMNNALVLHLARPSPTGWRKRPETTRDGKSTGPTGWHWAACPSLTNELERCRGRARRAASPGARDLQLQRIPVFRLTGSREPVMDRREFLSWVQGGLAGAAAATLLSGDGTLQAESPARRRRPVPTFLPGRPCAFISVSAGR